jgi:hypothetical protein
MILGKVRECVETGTECPETISPVEMDELIPQIKWQILQGVGRKFSV